MRKLLILAFDGLDAERVEKYAPSLHQETHGKTSLRQYLKQGGLPGGATNECFGQFITGKPIPEIRDLVPFDHECSLKGVMPTLFDSLDSVALDVPTWNWGKKHKEFHKRTAWAYGTDAFKRLVKVPDEEFYKKVEVERRSLTEDLYNHLWWDKLREVKETVALNKDFTMIYFWFTDMLGHMYKDGGQILRMYANVEKMVNTVKSMTDATVMIMSDHGMQKGRHKSNTAFWSLSEALLPTGFNPSLMAWYNIIRDWFDYGSGFTEKEENIIRERLRQLGYFE